MRILFVSREYPPESGGGGIGSYLATLAPALAERGHQVHVLSCFPGQAVSDELLDGVYVHRRPWLLPIPGIRRSIAQGLSRRFPTLVRVLVGFSNFYWLRSLEEPFDVIEYPDWLAEGWLISVLHPTALVAHLHTPLVLIAWANGWKVGPGVHMAGWFERFSVEHADKVLSPSRLLVDRLLERGWNLSSSVQVMSLPSPQVSGLAENTAVSDTLPVVLCIGRLEHRKAPEILVEAMKIIENSLPEARCTFLGADHGMHNGQPYVQWLQQIYNSGNCEFVGYVQPEEIPVYLDAARVFAMPSRLDNFPVSALEAMAYGRPVVLSDAVGLAELVTRREAGSVVKVNDSQAMAEALLPFLLDPALAGRVGGRARELAESLQMNQNNLAQREALYEDAIRHFDGTRRET